ncbi:EARP-interacting protein homolog isoform X2 [Apostichopus japonicus]|uniref:EARP-interacting protein homolog isoform X2 n=1 Tax=Stichopus japonicus TaxID=307972 RepID=UPI003AB4F0BE
MRIASLHFNSRALTSLAAESDTIEFLVGTQSLKSDNQVHLLQFDEDNNSLNKKVFRHREGEIWQLTTSPGDRQIFASTYSKIVDNKTQFYATVWKLPEAEDDSANEPEIQGEDEHSTQAKTLEPLCQLEDRGFGSVVSVLWEPQSDGSRVISLTETHILLWDLNVSDTEAKLANSVALEAKGHPKFTAGRWNPHHNNTQIATANDTMIRGWDVRSMKEAYKIENAHNQLVRDLDFNPNKQYYLASCGDDCKVKFWDIRNPSAAVLSLSDHSHWVWSVRYNQFHDQLVLTSSSDSRVILTNTSSISSEPCGQLDDEKDSIDGEREENSDDEDELDDLNDRNKEPLKEGVLATYEEHEDSVYAGEWSTADPWLFASLSYDGRMVINRVPRAVKYKILL